MRLAGGSVINSAIHFNLSAVSGCIGLIGLHLYVFHLSERPGCFALLMNGIHAINQFCLHVSATSELLQLFNALNMYLINYDSHKLSNGEFSYWRACVARGKRTTNHSLCLRRPFKKPTDGYTKAS